MVKPLIAAHRGYKAKYAENTPSAFIGAIDAGVDIIETDVQVTSDGVVVINHDPFTGRNYNKNLLISETRLEDLKALTNKTDPKEKMITFEELLQWFVEQKSHVQLMLDIKVTNNVTVLTKMVRSLLNVNDDITFWYDKVIFGLWSLSFYKFAVETNLLANFKIINITISPTIARRFLEYSQTLPQKFQLDAISLLHLPLIAPEFSDIHENLMKPHNVKLYIWTANAEESFQKALDWNAYGLVTDYPEDAMKYFKGISATEETSLLPHYHQPSILSIRGLQLRLRFALFRLFEFLLLNNLLIYKPVQMFIFKVVRLVVNDQ